MRGIFEAHKGIVEVLVQVPSEILQMKLYLPLDDNLAWADKFLIDLMQI